MSLLDEVDPITKSVDSKLRRAKEGEDLEDKSSKKGRVRSGELTIDSQKLSSFSLRRKKEKDSSGVGSRKVKTISKSQSRTPPDSPPGKYPEGKKMSSKGAQGGPSPNVKSSRKEYAHLLENEFSSGDEEDDDNFLLSKGHVAQEKRSAPVVTKGGDVTNESHCTINPAVLMDTFGTSPVGPNFLDTVDSNTTGFNMTPTFPVRFTPPKEARFPNSDFSPFGDVTTDDSDTVFRFDTGQVSESTSDPQKSIPVIPPPPPPPSSTSHTILSLPPVTQQPNSVLSKDTTPTTIEEPDWSISDELYDKCLHQFHDLHSELGLLSGEKARDFFIQSRLPVDELSKIWKLSDTDHDGSLTFDEFVIAMKLVLMRRKNFEIPSSLPESLKPSPKLAPKLNTHPIINIPPPPMSGSKDPPTLIPILAVPEPPLDKDIKEPPLTPPFRPHLPPFLTASNRSKTEPTIAISGVQPNVIEHIIVNDRPYAVVNISKKMSDREKKIEEEDNLVISSDFMSGDESIINQFPNRDKDDITQSSVQEPVISKLISLEAGEDSTGDEDETSALVTSGEFAPVPKPRKKKRPLRTDEKVPLAEVQRSRTVHGRPSQPPPKPAPYQKKSVSPPDILSDTSSRHISLSPDHDTVPMITTNGQRIKPKGPRPHTVQKPEVEKSDDEGEDMVDGIGFKFLQFKDRTGSSSPQSGTKDKGHGRSTSWDLTKMLREGDVRLHEDLPSADPPKPPPRRNVGNVSHGDNSDNLTPPGPLQRSASTGSISSTGIPTNITGKSRSSSIESGSLISALELSSTNPVDSLLPRASTLSRRPAPSPPIIKPKPKKPLYPPNFKKVMVQTEIVVSSSDEKPLLSEVYRKKSKIELQKSIKRLKEENDMFSNLNSELKKKLNELKQERSQLGAQLNLLMGQQQSPTR